MMVLLWVVMLGGALPLHAQQESFPYTYGKQDLWHLGAGVGAAALGGFFQEGLPAATASDFELLDPDGINGLDRWVTDRYSETWQDRSDLFRSAAQGVGIVCVTLCGLQPGESGTVGHAAVLAGMAAEAFLLRTGVTDLMKGSFRRWRPYTYSATLTSEEKLAIAQRFGTDPDDARRSFFSGHASNAALWAVFAGRVFSELHPESSLLTPVWIVGGAVAAGAGVGRVLGGMHFVSDVLVGWGVGGAIGWFIPELHRRDREGGLEVEAGLDGVGLRWRF